MGLWTHCSCQAATHDLQLWASTWAMEEQIWKSDTNCNNPLRHIVGTVLRLDYSSLYDDQFAACAMFANSLKMLLNTLNSSRCVDVAVLSYRDRICQSCLTLPRHWIHWWGLPSKSWELSYQYCSTHTLYNNKKRNVSKLEYIVY